MGASRRRLRLLLMISGPWPRGRRARACSVSAAASSGARGAHFHSVAACTWGILLRAVQTRELGGGSRLELEVLQEVAAEVAQVAQLRLGVLLHVVDAGDGGRQLLRAFERGRARVEMAGVEDGGKDS